MTQMLRKKDQRKGNNTWDEEQTDRGHLSEMDSQAEEQSSPVINATIISLTSGTLGDVRGQHL